VIVELYGLEVFGRHGVLDDERQAGQTFLFDVTLELDDPSQDRVQSTVDYREVAEEVKAVSDAARVELLETLAAAAADALVARFAVRQARVRVRKQRPAGIPAEWSGATAERPTHGRPA
jgi:7,8-dihydroneopterin aldolase/epimerase/oxygenase